MTSAATHNTRVEREFDPDAVRKLKRKSEHDIFIGGEVVMQLWNWLLPPLFGWRTLTFWQALGMLALCRILIGGHGWRTSSRSGVRRRVEERCENMSPEEKEKFRQRMRERFGFNPPAGEGKGR